MRRLKESPLDHTSYTTFAINSYTHDVFGHITGYNGLYYSTQDSNTHSYTNNRNPNWSYDGEGNVTLDDDAAYETDAAGRRVKTTTRDLDEPSQFLAPTADYFDGTGQLLKRTRFFGMPSPETNYFIRSSVIGKVISETTGTGAKHKTFVPANGVTLAEQWLVTFQGNTTEHLTFIHQDASGSGVQQTKANGDLVHSSQRTAEYDAMGRNIADPGPYITLDTLPPGDGGGGILIDSGQGYRPGRNTYTVDGLPVPESDFMMMLESGSIGGMFGLLEMTARMSAPVYLVRNIWGLPVYYGRSQSDAEDAAFQSETLHIDRIFFTGWEANWSIFSFQSQQQTQTGKATDIEKNARAIIAKNKQCEDFINSLLKRAAELTGVPSVPNPFSGNLIDFSEQKFIRPDGSTEVLEGQALGRNFALGGVDGRSDSYGVIGLTPNAGYVYPDYEYAIRYIHEAIHNAAVSASGESRTTAYTDRILLVAAAQPVSINGKPAYELPESFMFRYRLATTDKNYQNSTFYSSTWNSLLRQFCPRQ